MIPAYPYPYPMAPSAPVQLKIERFTNGDAFLIDADTGIPMPSDGGTPEAYPDLNLDGVRADGLHFEVGDDVGNPFLYDSVSGMAAGNLSGLPGTVRDGGLGPCSPTDFVDGLQLFSGATTTNTLVIRHRLASGGILGRSGPFAPGVFAWVSGTTFVLVFYTTSGFTNFVFGPVPATPGDPLTTVVQFIGSTYEVWIHDAAGTVLFNSSASDTIAFDYTISDYTLGGLAGTLAVYPDTGLSAEVYEGLINTPTDRQDIVAGTFAVQPDRSWGGLRSGIVDPSDTGRLVVNGGAGASCVVRAA